MITYFVVQSFTLGSRGAFIADDPVPATGAEHARRLAEKLAANKAGVIAFSRSGDQATGEFEDATVLFISGDLPTEVEEAIAA
ncbi:MULTISPECIES: hypothetical protein [unclassified Ensifer]|uniref:hypothetical protein n=1 Tax=unclassified Ensifer TaxID=2633371 RepID=UPI0008135DE5|nr:MULTISPECIES: hypothetical protein [unclassified Ensifer]OCP04408.1 hypothetical protein BBX50_25535 [Ensifer sp. LC11]OCP04688.1 hypothetical protein BC374_25555 [Ensifer sp. LC13]OCP13315.1 hypothetical protein BC362_05305 [Ensifer sp. LC14]OCP30512.1 hypothetical protein BC364_25570 [Ensifer sp. LC499]